ncbi:MAG: T9SS type A sorting domain-containing protein, partial [Bacteroidota bacterium]
QKVEPGHSYFYRLKQIDLNGQFSLSDVIELSLNDNAQINCYPNPVSKRLNIEYQVAIKKVEIFDLNGRMILKKEVQGLNPVIDVSELMNGYFWVRVTDQNGRSFQQIMEK